MAQVIQFSSRRPLSASKGYSQMRGVPFLHVGNLAKCEEILDSEEENVLTQISKRECGEPEEQLQELLDGELDQVSRIRTEKHISQCSSCAQKLEEYKLLKEHCASLSSKDLLSQEIKSRLRSRLIRELGLSSEIFRE